MDSKISELPVATALITGDLFPVVSGGVTKAITAGALSLNLPNVGNKGITKNTPVTITTGAVPLTASLVLMSANVTPYTISDGSPGQEITIVALGVCTLNIGIVSLELTEDDVLVILFTGTHWVAKSIVQSIAQWVP